MTHAELMAVLDILMGSLEKVVAKHEAEGDKLPALWMREFIEALRQESAILCGNPDMMKQ